MSERYVPTVAMVLLAWCWMPPVAFGQRDADPPVVHRLTVELDPSTHHLTVRDEIELPQGLGDAGIEFTLNAALIVRDSSPALEKRGANEEGYIRYALPAAPADGLLRVAYDGVIDFGLSDDKAEYTRGFRDTRGMVGPEGVYLDGHSAWIPRFDERLIRFSMSVGLPQDWHVISQGHGRSRDDSGRAQWNSGGPMEQVYLVGGPLVAYSDAAGAVDALVFLRQPDDALARKYLDATARYLEMYRGLIGPYPYKKFALVENFWETGYGMPSFTLLGPKVIRFPFILHSSYPHEILHNWWGNSVFVDSEQGNWCEGLTAYLADHLIKEQRGQAVQYRRNALQKYRNYVLDGRDFALSEFRSRHSGATEAVGYGKALMVFHMLRRQIGDDAFRSALAGFYRKHRGRRAGYSDLRAAFESVAERDLGPFFEQWIRRAGAPELQVTEVDVRPTDGAVTVSGLLQQVQPAAPFALQVPVHVQTIDGTSTFVVELAGPQSRFEFTVESPAVMLSVDPQFDVFRQLDPREIPASIGQVFGAARVTAILPTRYDSGATAADYRALVEAWHSDEHAVDIVLDSDLQALPTNHPSWILGRHNRFAAELNRLTGHTAIDANGGGFTAGGTNTPLEDHAIVAVWRHPQNVDNAIGWIACDVPQASAGLARKLPHYGKYSYLAFEGTEPTNIVKGQWDTSGSPLVVALGTDGAPPAAAGGTAVAAGPPPRQALAELPAVFSQAALLEHVKWLAAPQRGGRGLGTTELDDSADYIARQYASAGLEPGGDDGGWFQAFTVAEGPEGRPVSARNVIGLLRGTRTEWADQSVVLGAHYDHLGRGWPDAHTPFAGAIHPGADDNASGVAVLLELARNLVAEGPRSRTLVFAAFSAEECGRLGSRHYVDHPRLPLAGVRGIINLDTVGRLNDAKLAIHGTGTADEWPHIFRGCGFVTGIESTNVPGGAEGSDQMSFIEKGVPGVQVFTGAHEDYHRPTDSIDKVDGAGLVKVATFVKEALGYLLEREEPLTARLSAAAAPTRPASGGRKILFGVVPEFAFQGAGVKASSIVASSPAEQAGLLAGDILTRLDQEKIADLRAFSKALKTLQPGQEVSVDILRDGQALSKRVTVRKR